jgi:hypothetical protein
MNHKNIRTVKSALALSAALMLGVVSAQTNTPAQPSTPAAQLSLEQRQEQRALISIQQAERAQAAVKNLPAVTGKDFGAKYHVDTSAALYKEARAAFDAKKFFEAGRKAEASSSLVQGLVALYQANGLSVPQGLNFGGPGMRGGPGGSGGMRGMGMQGSPGMQGGGRQGQMGQGGQRGPGNGRGEGRGDVRGLDAANLTARLDEGLNRLKLELNYYKAGDARVTQLIARAEDLIKQVKATPAPTTAQTPNTQNQARTVDPRFALSRAAAETMQAAQALISAARGF